MDWCRFHRHQLQPIARRVARQIDKNVNFIAQDLQHSVLVADAVQIPPPLYFPLKPLGVLIPHRTAGVQGEMQLLPVPLLKQGFDEIAHRMAAKIRRDQANLEAPLGIW